MKDLQLESGAAQYLKTRWYHKREAERHRRYLAQDAILDTVL